MLFSTSDKVVSELYTRIKEVTNRAERLEEWLQRLDKKIQPDVKNQYEPMQFIMKRTHDLDALRYRLEKLEIRVRDRFNADAAEQAMASRSLYQKNEELQKPVSDTQSTIDITEEMVERGARAHFKHGNHGLLPGETEEPNFDTLSLTLKEWHRNKARAVLEAALHG